MNDQVSAMNKHLSNNLWLDAYQLHNTKFAELTTSTFKSRR